MRRIRLLALTLIALAIPEDARAQSPSQILINLINHYPCRSPIEVSYIPDTEPPILLSAVMDPFGLTRLTIYFNEATTNADEAFNYVVERADGTGGGIGVIEAVYNGTRDQVVLTLDPAIDPSQRYDLTCFEGISDLFGNPMPQSVKRITVPVPFRQDYNGYTATFDTELHSGFPDQSQGTNFAINADLDDRGVAQGVLRFENIFGGGAGQVPHCSYFSRAVLRLYTLDPGTPVRMLRLKVPWDEDSTWNSLLNGIDQPNEIETAVPEVVVDTSQDDSYDEIDVSADLEAWSFGEPNYGWVFLATSGNGWDFASSEHATTEFRPALLVEYYISLEPCIILEHPQSVTVLEGEPFTLSVLSRGADLTYQWFKNNAAIFGATNRIYYVPRAALSDQGTYYAVVDSECAGTCISFSATVSVRCPPNLQISHVPGGRLTLSWNTCAGTLQYAERLGGFWSNVVGAASPTNFVATAAQGFFRVQP